MTKRFLALMIAAAAVQAGGLFREFESNGVRGSVANPAGKTIVLVQPSGCNVEAVTVRVRFRAETATTGFRTAVASAPVHRCQTEAAMVTFDREDAERPILVAVAEMVVANNAAAPVE